MEDSGAYLKANMVRITSDIWDKDLGLDPEGRYDLKEIWGDMVIKGEKYSFLIPPDGCVFLKYKMRR